MYDPAVQLSAQLAAVRSRCYKRCTSLLGAWSLFFSLAMLAPLLLLSAPPLIPALALAFTVLLTIGIWQSGTNDEAGQQQKWREEKFAVQGNIATDPFMGDLPELSRLLNMPEPGLLITPDPTPALQVFSPVRADVLTSIAITTGFYRLGLNTRQRRAAIGHELGHLYLRTGFWSLLASCAAFSAYTGAYLGTWTLLAWLHCQSWWLLLGLPCLAVSLAHYLGLAMSALISRIHEQGADEIAEVLAGPGAIAECLIRSVQWHNARGYGLKRIYPKTWRDWPRYLHNEIMAEHPHELQRIERSRRKAAPTKS